MFSANDCYDPPCSLLRFMDIFLDVPVKLPLTSTLKSSSMTLFGVFRRLSGHLSEHLHSTTVLLNNSRDHIVRAFSLDDSTFMYLACIALFSGWLPSFSSI